jgi:hypothetical protein
VSIRVELCQIKYQSATDSVFFTEKQPETQTKNLPLKTPKNRLGHTSERFFLCDFLVCFGIFWETSCNQTKPYSKKATHFTKNDYLDRTFPLSDLAS